MLSVKHKIIGYSATDLSNPPQNIGSSIICPFNLNFALVSIEFPATPVSRETALPRTTFTRGKKKKANIVAFFKNVSRKKYYFFHLFQRKA